MKSKLTNIDTEELNISLRLLSQKALEKGYVLEYIAPSLGTDSGIMICKKDGREIRLKSTATSLTPSFGYFTAENKILTYNLLTKFGVPTPKTYEVTQNTIPQTLDFAKHSYVVKPIAMNHGDGITVGVTSKNQLNSALSFALNVSQSQTAIVQEQVYGHEYRFLVLQDKVIAVAGRQPASVVGDGKTSINELIVQANKDPKRGEGHKAILTKINVDDVVAARGKEFLQTIPKNEEKVFLLATSNLSKGGEAIDYTDVADDSLKNIAIAAAKACSLGIAGVDIITDNIMSPGENASYVIEVNIAPGLRMHHFPSEGKSRDVAGLIFESLEKQSQLSELKQDIIGSSEFIDIVNYENLNKVPARIDSGARTSAFWATKIRRNGNDISFVMFGPTSPLYTGSVVTLPLKEIRYVTSSTGHEQSRYVIELSVRIKGRRFKAKFTLSSRETQSYPILIGRNTLRGNFLVNTKDPGPAVIYKYPEEAKEYDINEAV